jgi:hypothetical protein
MSTLTLNPMVSVDPPASLPVSYLSVSSLDLYARCPIAWKRRYIDHEPDRASGKMVRGGAAGAALAQHYGRQIETGSGLSGEELLDEYSAEWDHRCGREDVDYGTDQPGALKDAGAGALALYHRAIAPGITPVSVEREIRLSWPGACFTLTGYLDLETADGAIVDYKTGARVSQDKAAGELQPTVYLAGRRAEGDPATRFDYHCLVTNKTPDAEVVEAPRSERQLDLLTHRVFTVARSIEFRWLNDCWEGTGPDAAWLCGSCAAVDCAWRRR